MKLSRSKQAMLNTVCELLLEVVTAICSFILPRLILSNFGSAYNGITSSISQFIGCAALLKSGIGSVTRAALYKPLAECNSIGISEIVNATSKFMKKVAIIFAIAVLGFASLYPFLVSEDFSWGGTFSLVLILSINTFSQYFFGFTYQMVIQADQKNYIISIVTIISTIINTIIASILILMGVGIHGVKLGSAIVFIVPPIFYNIWVKKKYNIISTIRPNYETIGQRWDAFGHQIANFINTNTDIMVATFFLGVKEVSVYSIYYMVGNAIKKAITAVGSGTTAAFGNMLANKEFDNLKARFSQFELLIYYISTILLTITFVLLTPFVTVYTKGISDVDYERPVFGYLICASIYFVCIKIPYEQIVFASGEFKNTRNGAFIEAGINIVISLILVNIIGLNGIIVGTIIAISYRTIRYHIYVCDNIIPQSKSGIIFKLIYTIITTTTVVIIGRFLPIQEISNYKDWFFEACVVSIITMIIGTFYGFLLFKRNMLAVFRLVINTFRRMK